MWLWQTISLWLSTENSLASNERDKSFVGTLALLALLLPWRDGIGNPTHLPVKANTLRKLIQIWDQRVGGVQLRCPPFTTSKKAKSCFYAVPFNLFFFFKRIHPFFFLRDWTVSHDAEELPCLKDTDGLMTVWIQIPPKSNVPPSKWEPFWSLTFASLKCFKSLHTVHPPTALPFFFFFKYVCPQ